MKKRIIEFLAILFTVSIVLTVFCIFWGGISLCVWLVLALFDITRNIMTAAIMGLAFTLLYFIRQQ